MQDYDRCKSGEGGAKGSNCPLPCSFLITHIGARNIIPWNRPNDTRRLYFYFAKMTVIEREKQVTNGRWQMNYPGQSTY